MTYLGSSVVTSGGDTTTSYLIVYPPPYQPGNILIMAAIGGGSSPGNVYASPPIQWTSLSASHAVLGVFYKVAQPIETAYYLPFSGQCMAAAVIVAYPASTIPSSLFASSSTGVITYTPTLPTGVTSTETVVMITGNQSSAVSPLSGGPQGAENINLPAAWAERVPAFGSGISSAFALTDYAVNVGVSDCLGPPPAATVTAAASTDFFTGFIVLNPTGVAPPPPPTPATIVPPPTGGPQFTAGSTPHGTAGLGQQYANLTYLISDSFGFLTSKAVFRGTQAVSQSLSASVVSNTITLDTVLEDPYGGWTGSPWYYWMPPQGVSGWFLCVGNVFTTAPATANATNPLVATNGADNYAGSLTSNPSVAHACGRPVIAMVYLLGGVNLVQLQAVLAGGANLATSVTAGTNSHLEICWISS